MEDKTLEFYENNAESYFEDTAYLEFSYLQDRFLELLRPGAEILDLGCGSGRDSLYFLKHGYSVTAVDGSEKMCKLACKHTGQRVRKLLFKDLDYVNQFDGIWACSSILHLPKDQLLDVFSLMRLALKDEGVVFASFKNSDSEGFNFQGRWYTNMNYSSFESFLRKAEGFEILDHWLSHDVRPIRSQETWLNILFKKSVTKR